jgi:hypothetical protein
MLRQIYGPTYENGHRKITMNQENYNEFKTPDIVIIIEVLRMDGLGHFLRMDGERTVKKVTRRQTRRREERKEKEILD